MRRLINRMEGRGPFVGWLDEDLPMSTCDEVGL